MIKNVIFALLKFALFLLVFAAFSFFPPFHIERVLGSTDEGTRVFVADGLIISVAVYVLVLAMEAARKRIRTSGIWTTVAFALALAAGFAAKFGLLTR